MKTENGEIEINGELYIKKSMAIQNEAAQKIDGLEYVMCRTYSAGVFAGYLQKREGKEVVLLKARRIWYWSGAASLSQLATEGTTAPAACKFPCEVERVELMEAIEIIPITAKAEKSIKSVAIWKQ